MSQFNRIALQNGFICLEGNDEGVNDNLLLWSYHSKPYKYLRLKLEDLGVIDLPFADVSRQFETFQSLIDFFKENDGKSNANCKGSETYVIRTVPIEEYFNHFITE
jgi:hypothetical protein